MKMSKIVSLVLAVLMFAMCFVACTNGGNDPADTSAGTSGGSVADTTPALPDELKGEYTITMWVSEVDGVADLFKTQIAAFETANPGVTIKATIEGVPEADAGSKVIADVATAPDLYCFAQDQLARLVQASALAAPGKAASETIKANNDAGSIAAASVAGTLYAYPMTSDNGYFLYYDKSIISEEDAKDMSKIIAACEKAGKKFRYGLENGYYTASFFFGAGCHSTWTMAADGKNFTSCDDNFSGELGMVAMKGMQQLSQSTCYDSNNDVFTDAGAIVTGIWNAKAATDHFGANLAAAELPSFTVDGKSYHLGSFSGNKLIGVKPQEDAKKAAILSRLAQFLTNEDCQNERFNKLQWGPSNLKAQATDAVKANVSLAALAAQNSEHGVPQGQVYGGWWDMAKTLGASAKTAKTDAELQAALDTYAAAIEAVFNKSAEEKAAWSVIGGICGTSWDTDFPMTKKTDTTWETEAYDLNAGEEFKCRQGGSWDVQCGADGVNGNAANFVVETTGKYIIRLTWDGAQNGTIELVPAP